MVLNFADNVTFVKMTKNKFSVIFVITALFVPTFVKSGILYPKVSRTRQVLSLDGLWQFSLSTNASFSEAESLTVSTTV